jgi:creatinine amidohydrolase
MRERRFELLRPAEIVAEMRERPLVFLAVGPLEWHGPHLPIGTDPLVAHGVALRVAGSVGGVVLPPIFCGTERERTPALLCDIGFAGDEWIVGMDFPANILKSLYYKEEFLALHLRETLELLGQQGYRLVVIVNGHGAANQVTVVERLAAELTARGPARVIVLPAWHKGERTPDVGHAGIDETSEMMALHPGTVDLATLPSLPEPLYNVRWAIVDAPTFAGHPSPDFTTREDPRGGATAERGEAGVRESARAIGEKVAAELRAMGFEPSGDAPGSGR